LLGGHGRVDWGQRSRDGAAAVVTDRLSVVTEWYPRRVRPVVKAFDQWADMMLPSQRLSDMSARRIPGGPTVN
jgi:hypothetical protein